MPYLSLSLCVCVCVCMRGIVCVPPRRVNEKLPLLIEYTKQMAGRTPIQCNAVKRTQGLEPLQPFQRDPMAPFKTFRMWNRKYNSTIINKLMRADTQYLNDLYFSIINNWKHFSSYHHKRMWVVLWSGHYKPWPLCWPPGPAAVHLVPHTDSKQSLHFWSSHCMGMPIVAWWEQ